MKKDATFFETSVDIPRSKRRYVPKDRNLLTIVHFIARGTPYRIWMSYDTSRKVSGSSLDEVIEYISSWGLLSA
jgi:hypothetical protein